MVDLDSTTEPHRRPMMSNTAQTNRKVAMTDAILAAAEQSLTQGDIDLILVHARDLRPAAHHAVNIAKVLNSGKFPNDEVMARAAAVLRTVRHQDDLAEYPRWDEAHATTMVSTPELSVETDVMPSDDDAFLEVRRTVRLRSNRRDARHVVWTGIVMLIPRDEAPAFVRDVVSSLV
jgi:hypothetical protein